MKTSNSLIRSGLIGILITQCVAIAVAVLSWRAQSNSQIASSQRDFLKDTIISLMRMRETLEESRAAPAMQLLVNLQKWKRDLPIDDSSVTWIDGEMLKHLSRVVLYEHNRHYFHEPLRQTIDEEIIDLNVASAFYNAGQDKKVSLGDGVNPIPGQEGRAARASFAASDYDKIVLFEKLLFLCIHQELDWCSDQLRGDLSKFPQSDPRLSLAEGDYSEIIILRPSASPLPSAKAR